MKKPNTNLCRATPLLLMLTACLYGPVAAAADAQDLDCVIEPSETADISSSVSGIMNEVLVKRGDWVEKDQVVARLESSVEQASVDLAQAEAGAQNLIRARRAKLDLANKRMQRVAELRKSKAVAMQDLDEAETDKVTAQADLEEARHERRLAELRLARAQRLLALRTIKSPVSGVVVAVHVSAGESVDNHPIMTIVQIDPLYVETILPVRMFGQLHQGDSLHVYPEAPVGGDFVARVSMVERVIDAPSGTFGVRLTLPNADKRLPAGLRCKLGFTDSVASGH